MRKRKNWRGNIKHDDFERALLTDTAPLDVPIIFSNDGFKSNLSRVPKSEGLRRLIDALVRNNSAKYTIPLRYRIRITDVSSRQLSLLHPAAQYRSCVFLRDYGLLIPYFCRREEISMRRPSKVGSSFFFPSVGSERKKYRGAAIDLLMHDKSVRNPGSYFAYAGHQFPIPDGELLASRFDRVDGTSRDLKLH
jgi:hypothetical protein